MVLSLLSPPPSQRGSDLTSQHTALNLGLHGLQPPAEFPAPRTCRPWSQLCRARVSSLLSALGSESSHADGLGVQGSGRACIQKTWVATPVCVGPPSPVPHMQDGASTHLPPDGLSKFTYHWKRKEGRGNWEWKG